MITYRSPVPSDILDLLELVEEYCETNKLSYDVK